MTRSIYFALPLIIVAQTASAEANYLTSIGSWELVQDVDDCMAWTVTADEPKASVRFQSGSDPFELRGTGWEENENPVFKSGEITVASIFQVGNKDVVTTIPLSFISHFEVPPADYTGQVPKVRSMITKAAANEASFVIRTNESSIGVFETNGFSEIMALYDLCVAKRAPQVAD